MNPIKATAAALGLALAMTAATAVAQTPAGPPPDAVSDPSLKGPDVVKFMGLKPGDKVADIVPGKFARLFSVTVGPKGKVYAVEVAEVVKVHPAALTGMQALAAAVPDKNLEVTSPPVNALALPKGLDAVFIRQNYHDLYDPFMGPADVPGFNKAVYDALKPGGEFVILDHAAAKGSGVDATNTLHRIDPDRVIADVVKAGFKLEAQSDIFANPADDRSKNVFAPGLRGQTDQFLFKFRKPK
ncbi:methyltransferase [Phenylobacterium sp.]|uniref:methyltransferase n=1 Tax=Phenylobacterium sp. TaxID=1871053 RepID=UPI001222C017|nr:methyltransferase [Phenylobacterium sp.]THD63020.1 MAG: methyltransferase [Phenylobacterium sp.]